MLCCAARFTSMVFCIWAIGLVLEPDFVCDVRRPVFVVRFPSCRHALGFGLVSAWISLAPVLVVCPLSVLKAFFFIRRSSFSHSKFPSLDFCSGSKVSRRAPRVTCFHVWPGRWWI
jgi:hypothetical protein